MSNERSVVDLRVGRIARKDVVSVTSDTTVSEVAQTMTDENVGDVVVTDDDEIVGIVTDRDLSMRLLTDEYGTNVLSGESGVDLTAGDVMSEDPLTIESQARVPRLLHHMNQASVRRVPVVDDGKVVGIITFDDLVVHLAGESAHVAAQLESLADVVHAESPASN
ncbi:CBS domain-containing protein [Natrinema gelatinilyticum]|uniref:CBS domain-containing protein n=1 Tax=Natrinema gelatinilyticum TaxID=2961571 RepID=UPI0020C3F8C0|nr:CBS domain-containing protein [Natrinema gelatinilyticum]